MSFFTLEVDRRRIGRFHRAESPDGSATPSVRGPERSAALLLTRFRADASFAKARSRPAAGPGAIMLWDDQSRLVRRWRFARIRFGRQSADGLEVRAERLARG